MSSKFAGLSAAGVADTFNVVLISPETDLSIKDKAGKESYIEVMSQDSDVARAFNLERSKSVNRKVYGGRGQELMDEDDLTIGIARMARLSRGWYLVDPATKEPIDVEFSEENAIELYTATDTHWIYRQAVVGSAALRNFMRRAPKS